MTGALSGLRLAVTVPPYTWFGGVDFDFAAEMAGELRRQGAELFEVETGGFVVQNRLHIERTVEALRAFRPDVALSLPNSSYLLLCRTARQENIFRDVLQIPSIMLWDHGLFQFPKVCLDPLPGTPEEAQTGAIARMRAAMVHPLLHHYSPDRGHVEVLDELGVIDKRRVHPFLQPSYPNFLAHGRRQVPAGAFRTPVAFAGNVYLNASSSLPFRRDPRLAGIADAALADKTAMLTTPLWNLLMSRIRALGAAGRRELCLTPDSTFFWSFLHDEVELVGNTRVRLHVLAGLTREFDFYGNFIEPEARSTLRETHGINFRRSLDYFTELPLLFMNSDVVVDVVNLGYNTGVSPKIMGCFACGGLILFDYKEDFAGAMGEEGSRVMYRSVDELNALVDRYLTDAALRRDVSRFFQHQVATKFGFDSLCRRILIDEPHWRS